MNVVISNYCCDNSLDALNKDEIVKNMECKCSNNFRPWSVFDNPIVGTRNEEKNLVM